MFLNHDNFFTLDVISGLERYAIEESQKAGIYIMVNAQGSKHRSGYIEYEAIKATYEDIKFIMSYLGYDLEREDGSISDATPAIPQDGIEYRTLDEPFKSGLKPAVLVIEEHKKSTEKIDGIVACIMGLDRAICHEQQGSVYDDPGPGLWVF